MTLYEEALSNFDKAIAINPHVCMFYHSIGLTYKDIGKNEKAIEMFEKACEISFDHIPSIFHLGL